MDARKKMPPCVLIDLTVLEEIGGTPRSEFLFRILHVLDAVALIPKIPTEQAVIAVTAVEAERAVTTAKARKQMKCLIAPLAVQ